MKKCTKKRCKSPKIEYWSMFGYGGNPTICGKHRSLAAAQRAAKTCEKRGGSKHWFLKVQVMA